MRRIILSPHAQDQMKDRGIPSEAVAEVVTNPNVTTPGKRPGRMNYTGNYAGRRLKVVVAEQQDPPVVVTAFWEDEE